MRVILDGRGRHARINWTAVALVVACVVIVCVALLGRRPGVNDVERPALAPDVETETPTVLSATRAELDDERAARAAAGPAPSESPLPSVRPWAAGVVFVDPPLDLQDARIELNELPASRAGESVRELVFAPFVAGASAPVRPDGTFSVPPPSRSILPRLRLRLVLADGQAFPGIGIFDAHEVDISVLVQWTPRTATGRLQFRGAAATGLARVRAERGGSSIGQVSIEADGSFTLSGLPRTPFDVVIESARPSGELARFPVAALAPSPEDAALDLGVLDVQSYAAVLELEVVDERGAPTSSQLRWRGSGVSGFAPLRAAPLHTLLLPPVVRYDLEIARSHTDEARPLSATPGRVRVVLGD